MVIQLMHLLTSASYWLFAYGRLIICKYVASVVGAQNWYSWHVIQSCVTILCRPMSKNSYSFFVLQVVASVFVRGKAACEVLSNLSWLGQAQDVVHGKQCVSSFLTSQWCKHIAKLSADSVCKQGDICLEAVATIWLWKVHLLGATPMLFESFVT